MTSPFNDACDQMAALGLSVIPLIPASADAPGRGKAPGSSAPGSGTGCRIGPASATVVPASSSLRVWRGNWPEANIGAVMGSPAGDDHQLVCIDFDTTDADEFDAIVRAIRRHR
jgi:hypothetical protein